MTRSIPAYAGKPVRGQPLEPPRGVDPRVRGEAAQDFQDKIRHPGRSPRTRGSLFIKGRLHFHHGSIPAYAGKPPRAAAPTGRDKVDPRVRGEAAAARVPHRAGDGRSPRTRGSRSVCRASLPHLGSIPAYAGKPQPEIGGCRGARVDPRVRGEAFLRRPAGDAHQGRSPRTRGSLGRSSNQISAIGSIPAYAGKPRRDQAGAGVSKVDPRVRGEAPSRLLGRVFSGGRSPRTRGSHQARRPGTRRVGSIPAYAGKPAPSRSTWSRRRVDPRVRGEARLRHWKPRQSRGRSPRTRGSRIEVPRRQGRNRSIPAYAGKPGVRCRIEGQTQVDPRVRGEASRA